MLPRQYILFIFSDIARHRLRMLAIDLTIVGAVLVILGILFLMLRDVISPANILELLTNNVSAISSDLFPIVSNLSQDLHNIAQRFIILVSLQTVLWISLAFLGFEIIESIVSFVNTAYVIPRTKLTFDYFQHMSFADKKALKPLLLFISLFFVIISLFLITVGDDFTIDTAISLLAVCLLIIVGVIGGFQIYFQQKWGFIKFRMSLNKVSYDFIRIWIARIISVSVIFAESFLALEVVRTIVVPWILVSVEKYVLSVNSRMTTFRIEVNSIGVPQDILVIINANIEELIHRLASSINDTPIFINELIDKMLPMVALIAIFMLIITIALPWGYMKAKFVRSNKKRVPIIIIFSIAFLLLMHYLISFLMPNVFHLGAAGPITIIVEVGLGFVLGLFLTEITGRKLNENTDVRICWHCFKSISWEAHNCKWCDYPLKEETSGPPEFLVNVIKGVVHRPQCRFLLKSKGDHLRIITSFPDETNVNYSKCPFCLNDI